MTREDLRPLTALRFAAALLVFLWHVPQTVVAAYTFSLGYAGVGFFFLLSGFILTYTYHGSFEGALSAEAVRSFYAARIARVYPLLLATTLIMLAVLAGAGGFYWSDEPAHVRLAAALSQLLLLQSWFAAREIHFGINGPAWSLSVEAFFYALFPFLAHALFRAFRGASALRVIAAAAALWLALTVLEAPLRPQADDWRFYIFPPARLIDFVVGMMLGVAFLRGGERRRGPLRPMSLEIAALGAVALLVYVSPLVPRSLHFAAWLMPAWCCLILVFARGRGPIARLLAHPVPVRLGEISFAFYLSHLAVITLLARLLGREHALFTPVAFAATLALSFALYHGVEQPLRGRVRALFSAQPRVLAVAA